MIISKSDYSKYNQCVKMLWLYKNRKDLVPKDIGEQMAGLIAQGQAVEEEAYKLFPGGVKTQNTAFRGAVDETTRLLKGGAPAIFQGSFWINDLYCRTDIIKKDEKENSWDIYEVKSATKIKDDYVPDLAFQKMCLNAAGLAVGRTFVIHINNEYVKKGKIDVKKLLSVKEVSADVDALSDRVRMDANEMDELIRSRQEPKIKILRQCHNPYSCMFLDHCWKNVPEHSIYNAYLSEEILNRLLDDGIVKIEDVPTGLITNIKYERYYKAVKSGKIHIDQKAIAKELKKYKYPLYFLDYETNSPAIPMFDGYRPYQRMVFQYSLHVIEKPGSEIKHYEFLADKYEDPSVELAKTLSGQIGAKGSVIAWYKKFEAGCNTEMGERYPEYAKFFESVNKRLLDLMDFFANGYYVDKDFFGSSSLKKVLPVLAPHLSYKELNIQEGGTASESWLPLILGELPSDEKQALKSDLLKYCELDTFAMVEIFSKLKSITKNALGQMKMF
jgi:hypothetical protein